LPEIDKRLPVSARTANQANEFDVTCSGATTDDITSRPQQTPRRAVAPQIDAVGANTDLITITIGGNDVGLASDAAQCRADSLDTPPCADKFVVDGVDRRGHHHAGARVERDD
jgi:lysophospholipase L1-like esterase